MANEPQLVHRIAKDARLALSDRVGVFSETNFVLMT